MNRTLGCDQTIERGRNMAQRYGGNWNLKDLLGDLMGATAELAPEPRAEIWASDLGKPYVDRWLQMKGVPYSNPADGRDLMTYFLGKQIELGFVQMLTRCGVAYRAQERLRVLEPDCLPVVGKPDLVAEIRDWKTVLDRLEEADRDPTGESCKRPRRNGRRWGGSSRLGVGAVLMGCPRRYSRSRASTPWPSSTTATTAA